MRRTCSTPAVGPSSASATRTPRTTQSTASTGELVWRTQVTEPGIPRPNTNYSTGGFIGATAVADGVVVGGTAVGGTPALHALDAATGAIKWQQAEAADTYASAAIANGVVFLGSTTDFTLPGPRPADR